MDAHNHGASHTCSRPLLLPTVRAYLDSMAIKTNPPSVGCSVSHAIHARNKRTNPKHIGKHVEVLLLIERFSFPVLHLKPRLRALPNAGSSLSIAIKLR